MNFSDRSTGRITDAIESVHMVPHDGVNLRGHPTSMPQSLCPMQWFDPSETVQESAVLRPIHRAYDALIVKCNALTPNRDAGFGIRFPRPHDSVAARAPYVGVLPAMSPKVRTS